MEYLSYKLGFNGVFSRTNLLIITDGAYVISPDDKKVNQHIEFHYLSTDIQLYSLTFLELNTFLKKYQTKSDIKISHATYLEYKMMILLCVDFTGSIS